MMPAMAIFRHDLRSLVRSWLVVLWLAGSFLLTTFAGLANWSQFQTAPLIASLLFPYLVFPWFLVVMALGVSPVSGSRADSLADGFLSRPIARYEYLLGSWAARVMTVLGVYLVVMVPWIALIALAERPMVRDDSVTVYGIVAALGVVGLVLSFQVSLAFLMATLLRKPLFAVVVLLVVWYPINATLSVFSLEEFSPISLSQALPTLLRQPWRATEDNDEVAGDLELETLTPDAAQFINLLSGVPQKRVESEQPFFQSDQFDDFSLVRVILGYGIPTLLAVGLATLCFCWRDL